MGETMNRTMDEITDTNESMDDLLSRSWWMLALRGVLALAFGILAFIWPSLTLAALVALFAAYALISGVVSILGAIRNRKADREWWLILILGLVSVAAGVISIMQPALTALVLVLMMGANALVTGVLDIAVAIRLRKTIEGEWLLIAAGIASIIFGWGWPSAHADGGSGIGTSRPLPSPATPGLEPTLPGATRAEIQRAYRRPIRRLRPRQVPRRVSPTRSRPAG